MTFAAVTRPPYRSWNRGCEQIRKVATSAEFARAGRRALPRPPRRMSFARDPRAGRNRRGDRRFSSETFDFFGDGPPFPNSRFSHVVPMRAGPCLNPAGARAINDATRKLGDGLSAQSMKGNMIKEHDRIVLKSDIPAEGLKARDVGTVVHVYRDGSAYEVEFTTLGGETAAERPWKRCRSARFTSGRSHTRGNYRRHDDTVGFPTLSAFKRAGPNRRGGRALSNETFASLIAARCRDPPRPAGWEIGGTRCRLRLLPDHALSTERALKSANSEDGHGDGDQSTGVAAIIPLRFIMGKSALARPEGPGE